MCAMPDRCQTNLCDSTSVPSNSLPFRVVLNASRFPAFATQILAFPIPFRSIPALPSLNPFNTNRINSIPMLRQYVRVLSGSTPSVLLLSISLPVRWVQVCSVSYQIFSPLVRSASPRLLSLLFQRTSKHISSCLFRVNSSVVFAFLFPFRSYCVTAATGCSPSSA